MLTDEEIKNIWNECPQDRFPVPEFARAIERAVLAKAIPKQEPVAVMGNNGRTQAKWEFADEDLFLKCCSNNTPLYADQQPTQAAAIPEKKYIIDPRNDDGEYYLLGSDINAMLSKKARIGDL